MLIDSALKMVLGGLAPAGPNARLTVLIFHRVLATRDPLRPHEPTVTEFADILDWVQRWFTVLPLSEAITRLRSASLPARALAITFDDGYADNRDLAVPELQRRGLSATFFIATGYLDGGRMFNDTVIEAVRGCRSEVLDVSDLGLGVHRVGNDDERRAAIGALLPKLKQLGMEARLEASAKVAERARVRLPDDLMMTSDDLAYVAKVGMELGGHTDSHPILARLPEAAARSEIELGRKRLQNIAAAGLVCSLIPMAVPVRITRMQHAIWCALSASMPRSRQCTGSRRAGHRCSICPGSRLGIAVPYVSVCGWHVMC